MNETTADLCTCGHTRYVHGPDGCDVASNYIGIQCDCTWFQSVEEL